MYENASLGVIPADLILVLTVVRNCLVPDWLKSILISHSMLYVYHVQSMHVPMLYQVEVFQNKK